MNQLVTPVRVMRRVAKRLVNNMRFGANVARDYSDEFAKEGAKIGYTTNVRLPQRYKVTKGTALVAQPVEDKVVPISVTDQANVGLDFSMASLTMEVEDYRKRYIDPAVDSLINTFDLDGLKRAYKAVANCVGTPGTVPGSTGTVQDCNRVYLLAGTKLTDIGVPEDGRVAMINAKMHAYLTSANAGLFHPGKQIAEGWRTGQFSGEALGVQKWFTTQNIPRHTVGPLGGTPQISGAGQTGSSILTKGWTAAAAARLKEGDVVQFDGVYEINTLNYESTGDLKDFVVTQDFASAADGTGTINIWPPLVTSGNYQNCSASPADSAAITIFGHASSYASKVSAQGLIYDPDAFAAVMVDLEQPGGSLWVNERISNKALGVSVRFLKNYKIETDQSPARLDIMYGWKTIRGELACRVAS